jgi:hypothetical protein
MIASDPGVEHSYTDMSVSVGVPALATGPTDVGVSLAGRSSNRIRFVVEEDCRSAQHRTPTAGSPRRTVLLPWQLTRPPPAAWSHGQSEPEFDSAINGSAERRRRPNRDVVTATSPPQKSAERTRFRERGQDGLRGG